MNRITMNIYSFVLSYLMVEGVAAMEGSRETQPLLPKSSRAINTSESKESLDKNSVLFRDAVDNLAKHFENFSDLPPETQAIELEKWKDPLVACLMRQHLSNSGFRNRLEVSAETADKLKAVDEIYRNHKKQKRLEKQNQKGSGCILQ